MRVSYMNRHVLHPKCHVCWIRVTKKCFAAQSRDLKKSLVAMATRLTARGVTCPSDARNIPLDSFVLEAFVSKPDRKFLVLDLVKHAKGWEREIFLWFIYTGNLASESVNTLAILCTNHTAT